MVGASHHRRFVFHAQRHGEIAAEVDIGYWVEALLVLLHPFALYNQRTQHGFSNERITAGLTAHRGRRFRNDSQ